ncbi:MAG: transketolase C-terminal domain-containing protein [Bacteroidota bacterium]
MRAEFAQAIIRARAQHPEFLFLTGDLGYMALEGVREHYGDRFINAGVAEQNMISVAAGLARGGFVPWVYSIAPFAVLRPYEQIRNDVCLHGLPVKIVGNGGGYGYGIMGATHHTLEDIAVMRVLPRMRVYIPLTGEDVEDAVGLMGRDPSPNYLRLNLPVRVDEGTPPFAPWRRIRRGRRAVVIGAGPVLGNILALKEEAFREGLDIWCAGILPLEELPEELVESIRRTGRVVTVEEHYRECGLNEAVAARILPGVQGPLRWKALAADGYPSGRYGSQAWHQRENALAGEGLARHLKEVLDA